MINRRQFLHVFITIIAFNLKPLKTNAIINELNIGQQAPYFNLPGFYKYNKNKTNWTLNDFDKSWLILYFYPKDFTSGCTIEAKGFQTLATEFDQLNAKIVGISADNKEQHESFCNSQNLNYILLSDQEGKISKEYFSWSFPFSKRNTYLIDPNGIIRAKWTNVRPLNHSKEVLEKLTDLQI